MKILLFLGILLISGCTAIGLNKNELKPAPCNDARYKELFGKPSMTVQEQREWDSLRAVCEELILEQDRRDREEYRANLNTELLVSLGIFVTAILGVWLF